MLGILPAAGEGSRWGGYFKELLPIGHERWLIDSAIDALTAIHCFKICVVTSKDKIHEHALHFSKDKYKNLDIFFVIQKERKDIWGAILAALPYSEDYNYFCMPDTILEGKVFTPNPNHFTLSIFETNMPERFGVFVGDSIQNKNKDYKGKLPCLAWGALSWPIDISTYWLNRNFDTYTDAINSAISYQPTYGTRQMDNYIDFATWKDYSEWIKQNS